MNFSSLCRIIKHKARINLYYSNVPWYQCTNGETSTRVSMGIFPLRCLSSTGTRRHAHEEGLIESEASSFLHTIRKSKPIHPDHLVQLENPDNFGIIGRIVEEPEEDEGDKMEEQYTNELPLHKDKLPMQKYINMIKLHVANNRIKEAIDILEVRMLKEDRVKPDSFIYNLLIGSCARVGYTDKAFKLFNAMKRRRLKVSGGIYTSLFNACANSPWKEDGLKRVLKLRQLMIEKSITPNTTIFNCMIKAYGRCGDNKKAFEVVDEMLSLKIPMRTHTFNFLLQACISDKEAGFRSALFTWRKMLSLREKPNIYSFNLMLRCIKECGFGDNKRNNEIVNDLLSINPPKRTNLMLDSKPAEILNIMSTSPESECSNSQLITIHQNVLEGGRKKELPNFLARFPETKHTISFGEVRTVHDRFIMAGEAIGILKEMSLYGVKPDIKFITQLLELIPATLEEENKLMTLISKLKIRADINFYNSLMKKRCFRCDYTAAKDVLTLIKKHNKVQKRINRLKRNRIIKPDVMTYGVLAMCCQTKESAAEFIKLLKSNYMRINSHMMGALLHSACFQNDFEYMKFVIDTVVEEKIPVNDVFINRLKKSLEISEKIANKKYVTDDVKNCQKIVGHSSKWIKMLKLQEQPTNPYTQFKVNLPESLQYTKDHVKFKKRIYRTNRRVPRYQVNY